MGDHYLPRHLLNGFAKPAIQSRRSAALFRYEVPSVGRQEYQRKWAFVRKVEKPEKR